MSAIFGIINWEGRPVSKAVLGEMSGMLSRRAPEHESILTRAHVGIGCRINRTTPESQSEVLPWIGEEGLWITADARLDNREDLARHLGMSGVSDSRYIFAAYQKWGERCPAYLIGDYSFVIWDARKERLFAAVDSFSVRPLCYYNDSKQVVFASELRALLPGELVPRRINEIRVAAQFLEDLAEHDYESTLLEDVYYLPAGHFLSISRQGKRVSRYWNPLDIPNLSSCGDYTYQEQFLALLNQSVAARLRSTKDTALALSGGIDSSAVAACSKTLLSGKPQKQWTFSAINEHPEGCIESSCIDAGIESLSDHAVTIDASEVYHLADRLENLLPNLDFPNFLGSVFLLCMYFKVSDQGLQVLLDGAEGDTTLGIGPTYMAYQLRNGALASAWKEAGAYNKNSFSSEYTQKQVFMAQLKSAVLPAAYHRFKFYKTLRSTGFGYSGSVPFKKEFRDKINLRDRLAESYERAGFGLSSSSAEKHKKLFHRPMIGRMYYGMDMLSSAAGLETRHPYLDRRLVEFALGLPIEHKNRQGWEKYILRQAAPASVPPIIRWRRKRDHVGWQFHAKVMTALRQRLQRIIGNPDSLIFEYLDYGQLKQAFDSYVESKGVIEAGILHTALGLESWLSGK